MYWIQEIQIQHRVILYFLASTHKRSNAFIINEFNISWRWLNRDQSPYLLIRWQGNTWHGSSSRLPVCQDPKKKKFFLLSGDLGTRAPDSPTREHALPGTLWEHALPRTLLSHLGPPWDIQVSQGGPSGYVTY